MRTTYVLREARAQVDLMPDLIQGTGGYVLTRVIVGNQHMRGKGFGRAVMARVLADADREGIILILVPDSYNEKEGLDQELLEKWYARLGFRPPRSGIGWWIRKPSK